MRKKANGTDIGFPKSGEYMTEAAFGAAVGRDQSTVSHWITEGVLTRGADAITWLRELVDHLAKQAAGRLGRTNGKFDLVEERARLAHEQANKTAFELRKARGEFVPGLIAAAYWNSAASIVRQSLLGIPHGFKSRCPTVSPKDIDTLDNLIREVLTNTAMTRLPPEFYELVRAWEDKGIEMISGDKQRQPRRQRTASSKKAGANRKKGFSGHHKNDSGGGSSNGAEAVAGGMTNAL